MEQQIKFQTKICPKCQASFDPSASRQTYCNPCKILKDHNCQICLTKFKPSKGSSGNHCSKECSAKARTKSTLQKKPCEVCKKEFKPSYEVARYCSKFCAGVAYRARNKHERTCTICQKVFKAKEVYAFLCSFECQGKYNQKPRNHNCERCNKEIPFNRYRFKRFCSKDCIASPIGSTRTTDHGYIMIRVGNEYPYPTTKGWILEHRKVMEQKIGRPMLKDENVHHINGIRNDNRLENLELWVKPQTPGQRVSDLVAYVVANYETEIREFLKNNPIIPKRQQNLHRN